MSNPDETLTTTITKDAAGKEVISTTTTSGPAETVTVSKPTNGPEVTTSIKTGAPSGGSSELAHYITIWSRAVETQMHFNEMSVKSRQLGLTFVVAALGVAVVLMSKGEDYVIDVAGWFGVHVAVVLVLAGAGAIALVRILDLGVYHRMLRGAVAFGEELEERKIKGALGVTHGMTQAISLFSRYPGTTFSLEQGYTPSEKKITAERKIRRFYFWTILVLVVFAVALFFVTFHQSRDRALPRGTTSCCCSSPCPANSL